MVRGVVRGSERNAILLNKYNYYQELWDSEFGFIIKNKTFLEFNLNNYNE